MFIQDEQTTHLEATPGMVYRLLNSINQINLALGDAPASPTFAYICTLKTKKIAPIEIYIMLYQPKHNITQFYRYEGGPVDETVYPELEIAANEFAENMGFMMDNMYFDKLEAAKKKDLLLTLPPFTTDRSSFQSAPPEADSVEIPVAEEETNALKAADLVDLGVEAEVILNETEGFSPNLPADVVVPELSQPEMAAPAAVDISAEEAELLAGLEEDMLKEEDDQALEPAAAVKEKPHGIDPKALLRILSSF